MQNKIVRLSRVSYGYLLQLRDVRVAGQAVFILIVLLVSWSGIKAIDTNYSLDKQVSALQQQNAVQQLENSNLALQNTYYNSNQYLELSARENFGLGAAGEKELLVPANVALSYTVPMPAPQKQANASNAPAYQTNFRAWLAFFLHRH